MELVQDDLLDPRRLAEIAERYRAATSSGLVIDHRPWIRALERERADWVDALNSRGPVEELGSELKSITAERTRLKGRSPRQSRRPVRFRRSPSSAIGRSCSSGSPRAVRSRVRRCGRSSRTRSGCSPMNRASNSGRCFPTRRTRSESACCIRTARSGCGRRMRRCWAHSPPSYGLRQQFMVAGRDSLISAGDVHCAGQRKRLFYKGTRCQRL